MHFLYKDVESLLDRGRQLGVLLDMSWNEGFVEPDQVVMDDALAGATKPRTYEKCTRV